MTGSCSLCCRCDVAEIMAPLFVLVCLCMSTNGRARRVNLFPSLHAVGVCVQPRSGLSCFRQNDDVSLQLLVLAATVGAVIAVHHIDHGPRPSLARTGAAARVGRVCAQVCGVECDGSQLDDGRACAQHVGEWREGQGQSQGAGESHQSYHQLCACCVHCSLHCAPSFACLPHPSFVAACPPCTSPPWHSQLIVLGSLWAESWLTPHRQAPTLAALPSHAAFLSIDAPASQHAWLPDPPACMCQ